MPTAHVVLTLLAAAMAAYSAATLFIGVAMFRQYLADYGVPRSWRPWLATTKAAGAAGVLVGLFIPAIGIMAGTGLTLYSTGAAITVARARYFSHVAFPLIYLAPVAAAMALGRAT